MFRTDWRSPAGICTLWSIRMFLLGRSRTLFWRQFYVFFSVCYVNCERKNSKDHRNAHFVHCTPPPHPYFDQGEVKRLEIWPTVQAILMHVYWIHNEAEDSRRPTWLAEGEWPGRCDIVRDGRAVTACLFVLYRLPWQELPSWWNFQLLLYSIVNVLNHELGNARKAWPGTLVDPCLLSDCIQCPESMGSGIWAGFHILWTADNTLSASALWSFYLSLTISSLLLASFGVSGALTALLHRENRLIPSLLFLLGTSHSFFPFW